jgi:hypothetical protein
MAETMQPIMDKELGSSPEATNMSESSLENTEGQELREKTPESRKKSNENFLACLQVLGAFFCMFNSWFASPHPNHRSFTRQLTSPRGIANSYGAFQTYYEGALLKNQTPSRISWIGSIQAFLVNFAGGFLTGPIYDAGYLRALVVVGTITGVFGMMMTSICKQYWQFVLAQGLTVGLGSGCLLLPSVAVMPAYFKTRRALATGIGASGSSIGTYLHAIS